MRLIHALLAALAISACTATSLAVARPNVSATAPLPDGCAGRELATSIDWHVSDRSEVRELSRWCRAVGMPIYVTPPGAAASTLPTLDQLVVVSWNAHLAEGEVDALVNQLRAGDLTDGQPVQHFVLLVQELYRRGEGVPAFDPRDRSAFAIKARNPKAPDISDHVRDLGLSVYYVPAMRNGPDLREDRGNAILSTEPLLDPFALELPLARQRRVTVGAAVDIQTADGPRQLQLVNAHLEPLSSPKTLWFFKNPRVGQVKAILDLMDQPRFTDRSRTTATVLGGDFNTVRSGAGEDAIHHARVWARGPAAEDARNTHMMGRLDYLFFNLQDGWSASTRRLDERFGSDHHPIVGRFSR